MTKSLAPHLNFHGNARQALSFYGTVLNAEPVIRTYGDFGMPTGLPDTDKVVWGQVVSTDGVRIMAYDVPNQQDAATSRQRGRTTRENGLTLTDQPSFLAMETSSVEEASAIWDALNVEANVVEPLAASEWSAGFGMITDQFGTTWAISVASTSA